MVLPAMVYVPTEDELVSHFRAVAQATSLPIMLYNNPPAYRVSIGARRARSSWPTCPTSWRSRSPRPTPAASPTCINAFGDRFVLMAGLDDVALEGLMLGAEGWVSGLTNAFPAESIALYDAVRRGDLDEALAIYRWFMPLLHLDAEHDLVQSIKLAEQVMGRGSERVRPPRHAADRRAPRRGDPAGRAGRRHPAEARRRRREPHTFFCIDGHTAGNPVRLVTGGAAGLDGASM